MAVRWLDKASVDILLVSVERDSSSAPALLDGKQGIRP